MEKQHIILLRIFPLQNVCYFYISRYP